MFSDSTPFGIADVATAIFMDSVGCLGNEDNLIDCDYDSNHDCYHFEDVGIHCGQNFQHVCNYSYDSTLRCLLCILTYTSETNSK